MDQALDIIKAVFSFIWDNLIYINMLFAIIVVFFQRKEPKSAWAWLLILYFIPIIGFVFYLLAGTDMHKRKIFKNKEVEDRINEIARIISGDNINEISLENASQMLNFSESTNCQEG